AASWSSPSRAKRWTTGTAGRAGRRSGGDEEQQPFPLRACTRAPSAAVVGVVLLGRRGRLGVRIRGPAEQADGLAGLAEPASIGGLAGGGAFGRVGPGSGAFRTARGTLRVRRRAFSFRARRRRTGF